MWWHSFREIISMLFFLLNIVLSVGCSIVLISQKNDPVKTLSWVIIMLSLPYIGIVLYFLFGRNLRKEKIYSRKGAGDARLKAQLSHQMLERFHNASELPPEIAHYHKLIVQNLKSSQSMLLCSDKIDIYFSGKEAIAAMYQAMEQAQKHIHLQSFILEDDKIGNAVKELLIRKSRQGVEVRLIFDGYGGRKLGKRYISELKEAGVEVLVFSPFRFILLPPLANYRNHRKLLIVDGNVGFLGGVNIADRYCDGGVFTEWRDTHIRVEGESVMSLQASFLLDRFFIMNKDLRKRGKYFPRIDLNAMMKGDSLVKRYYMQTISSGPDSDWQAIMQCFFTAITQAKRYVHIITPYYIPSETISDAIKITALSDVEVSIMVPEKSDTRITTAATHSYFSELLDAGVNIYLFERGFNHSKVLSIDGEYCIIGSANMDNRSFMHNFEVTSVIFDRECAKVIDNKFNEDLKRCRKVEAAQWNRRPYITKVAESAARLVSPLL